MYGSDVGTALKYDPVEGFDPERVQILKGFVRDRLQRPEGADPILVFVKPEPHKREKVLDERWRLISAVGIIDTMADRVMLGWLQRRVLCTVGRTPVLIGWSPYQGGYRLLTTRFSGMKALAADRSSWDWTVAGWLLLMVKDLIHRLAVEAPPFWHQWLDARWAALFRDAVFGFRSGERVQQSGWGVMKSGCYLTIWINSVCQMILHSAACMRLSIDPDWGRFFCMGDDTLQSVMGDVDAYLDQLRALGAVIKETNISDELEFCGHVMKDLTVRPVYRSKHVFKVLNCPPEILPEVLGAYQWAYADDPEMWRWLRSILSVVAPDMLRNLGPARQLLHNG